jgi:hydrogenase maturation protease
MMGRTLVLGVGNLLLSDDGVGIHAIRRLRSGGPLPEQVEIVDGGTLGLGLLPLLVGVSRLIIVDAVDEGRPAGTLVRLDGDQVPAYLTQRTSMHEIGLPDMLALARVQGAYPQEVVIWGVQPASVAVGLELSPAVAAQLDLLVRRLSEELGSHGSLR